MPHTTPKPIFQPRMVVKSGSTTAHSCKRMHMPRGSLKCSSCKNDEREKLMFSPARRSASLSMLTIGASLGWNLNLVPSPAGGLLSERRPFRGDGGAAHALVVPPCRLRNRYFLVRHGESVLEERSLLMSNAAYKYDATYGLTPRGTEQVVEAAATILDTEWENGPASPAWIYTSNFQRTWQSTLVLRQELGLLFSDVRTEFSGLLDPRKVGALDFQALDNMEAVWEADLKDPASTPPPVESSLQPRASVDSCLDLYRRATEAFSRLEGSYAGQDVVLVGHQDVLSVFCASMIGTDLGRHHLDYPFELGQVRCLDLSGPAKEGEPDRNAKDFVGYSGVAKAVDVIS